MVTKNEKERILIIQGGFINSNYSKKGRPSLNIQSNLRIVKPMVTKAAYHTTAKSFDMHELLVLNQVLHGVLAL